MNARHFVFASAALLAVAACTIKSNDTDGNDAGSSGSPGTSSGTSGGNEAGASDAGSDAAPNITLRTRDGGPDAGDAGECLASVQRGPLCHGDETPETPAKCASECDTASTAFGSDIAYAISACIDDYLTDLGQDPSVTNCELAAPPCVALATAASCKNDVEDYCNGIVTQCPDKGTANKITKADCVQYMQGSTVKGKQLLLDCLHDEASDENVCKICMDAVKSVHSGD